MKLCLNLLSFAEKTVDFFFHTRYTTATTQWQLQLQQELPVQLQPDNYNYKQLLLVNNGSLSS